MAELTAKERTVKEVYENREQGYGSIKDTFQQAKAKDASIKLDDVKKYLNKQPHRQTQFTYKKFNSFVSPGPKFEFEMDLIDMTAKAKENDGYQYGWVAIDNFTKFAWVIPMKEKDTENLINACTRIFEKMGKPKQVYSDQEPALTGNDLVAWLHSQNIKHITSISGAHTVERFNRTLKEKTQTRLNAMGISRDKWVEQLDYILNKYNRTEHTTTKMTPMDAKKPQNEMTVKFNLEMAAKRNRKYPELKKDDRVRIMEKPTKTGKKGYDPKWTPQTFKVLEVDGKQYLVNNPNAMRQRKLYSRHELLKI